MNNLTMLKRNAAHYAVEFIESNMTIGLGHGTTSIHAIKKISEKYHSGELKNIKGIPSSHIVFKKASKLNIPLTTLEKNPIIDINIDGADEVDPNLELIKGGGGALLREKIIAQASKQNIIIVDPSKLSTQLGTNWPLPIEVIQFGWKNQARYIETLGAIVSLRLVNNQPFLTDQNNYILDCNFGPIDNVYNLADNLDKRAGIVDHGLFLGLATDVVVAHESGIQHNKRNQ